MATAIPNPLAVIKQGSKWGIICGVLLVIFGMLAIGEPFLAAIAVATFIGWLLIVVGIVHAVLAFHAHSGTSLGWKLLVGLAYIFIGGYLLYRPLVGVATLALLLAFLFFGGRGLCILFWGEVRSHGGAVCIPVGR